MKKGFYRFALSGMLVAAFGAGLVVMSDKDHKEKLTIIVADKKERDKSGSETKPVRPGDRRP